MKLKKTGALILTLILIATLLSGCTSKTAIKLSVKKGEKYKITTVQNTKMSMEVNAKSTSTFEGVTTIVYIYNIIDVDKDGVATISVKYDSYSDKEIADGKDTIYDSKTDSKKTDPKNLKYNSIVGQSFTCTLGQDGKVKGTEGVSKIIDDASAKLNTVDKSTKDTVISGLEQDFGPGNVKETLNQLTDFYPQKKVEKGDKWFNEQTFDYGLPMVLGNTLQLKDIKDGLASINVDSTITTNHIGAVMVISGIQQSYDITGEEKGLLYLNLASGFIETGDLDFKMKGTETVSAFGKTAKVPFTEDEKVSIKTEKQ